MEDDLLVIAAMVILKSENGGGVSFFRFFHREDGIAHPNLILVQGISRKGGAA
jgi:hypothetical protein